MYWGCSHHLLKANHGQCFPIWPQVLCVYSVGVGTAEHSHSRVREYINQGALRDIAKHSLSHHWLESPVWQSEGVAQNQESRPAVHRLTLASVKWWLFHLSQTRRLDGTILRKGHTPCPGFLCFYSKHQWRDTMTKLMIQCTKEWGSTL